MNKAFIFDMDGVIVNSEGVWEKYENNLRVKLLGEEISKRLGDSMGVSVNSRYDMMKKLGIKLSRGEFQAAYDKAGLNIYSKVNITSGTDKLINFLIKNSFKLGLVSSSATSWINKILQRLSVKDKFESIISLNERLDIKPKPNPDGYIAAMKSLMSQPSSTIILEDSNLGIASAKASGAFTIAFTQNLVKGYRQIDADAKVNSMEEVIGIVKNHYKE